MSEVNDLLVSIEVDTPPPVYDWEAHAAANEAGETRPPPAGAPTGAGELQQGVYGTTRAGGRDLDVWFHARADRTERRPGILMVHGGAWIAGDGQQYLHHAHALAGRGYVTASISYRLIGEERWPACLEDVKTAVRWMRANADELGLDAGQIAVMGGSAGGHLAAMAALTVGHYDNDGGHSDQSSRVQAAVCSCPPLDLYVDSLLGAPEIAEQFYVMFFGEPTEEAMLAASPLHQVSPDAAPIQLLVGDHDPITPMDKVSAMGTKLADAGVPCETVVYPGRTHGFEAAPEDFDDLISRVDAFLCRHLGVAAE